MANNEVRKFRKFGGQEESHPKRVKVEADFSVYNLLDEEMSNSEENVKFSRFLRRRDAPQDDKENSKQQIQNFSVKPQESTNKTSGNWNTTDFSDIKELAAGGFASVFSATIKNTRKKCALKVLKRAQKESDQRFLFEFTVHARLQHTNIVKVYGFYQEISNNFLVLEFCCKGDLIDYINRQGFERNKERSRKYIRDISSALVYIHSKMGIVHADIKPENVVVNLLDTAKITDFGCAVRMLDFRSQISQENGGTPIYRPMELLTKPKKSFDSTVDVWALGCVSYELMFRRHPFFSNWNKENEDRGKAVEKALLKMVTILNHNDVFWVKGFQRMPRFRSFLQKIFGVTQSERARSVDVIVDAWLQDEDF